jgi:hypothetical protein
MIDRQLQTMSSYRWIQNALNKEYFEPLTKVTVTCTEKYLHPVTSQCLSSVTTHVISSRQALEMAILERNQRHFAQAQDTPWHQPPPSLINNKTQFNLYTDADNNAIQLPSGTFLETATVLQVLKDEAAKLHPKWSSDVAFQVFISALLHWNESTSTSPPGHLLGIYKSLLTAFIDSSGEFRTDLDKEGISI